jgi:hypothetical protein
MTMIRTALATLALLALPATSAFGAVIFYDNEGGFLAQMTGAGYVLEGLETFEENNLPENSVLGMTGPVCGGIPWVDGNGQGFPTGLDQLNLCISSVGGDGSIALLTNGFFGAVTDVLGANTFVDSTNMEFQNGITAGVGFIVTDLLSFYGSDITVYDTSNNVIGTTVSATGRAFVGVYSDVAIGYINVAAQNGGGEMLDDIQMYNIPGPAALSLLALAGLARRRRR